MTMFTERGEINVIAEFDNAAEALRAGFDYRFTAQSICSPYEKINLAADCFSKKVNEKRPELVFAVVYRK